MITFGEITQLPRYGFIQRMKPSLRMYKALRIQQTPSLTIQCTMSICYGTKQPCREDALLALFVFLPPCLKIGLDAVPEAFWFHSFQVEI